MSPLKSSFTAEELADAVRTFDVEVSVTEDLSAAISHTIDCNIGDFEFGIWPRDHGPFFEEALMVGMIATDENPIEWALAWNSDYHWSTGVAQTDEVGALVTNDQGEFILTIRRRIGFYGGVSDDALRSWIGQFILEFLTFVGLEEEDDSTVESSDSIIDLPEALVAELELRSPQTARELARSVNASKSEVNAILYGRPDLFSRKHENPPLWSLNLRD